MNLGHSKWGTASLSEETPHGRWGLIAADGAPENVVQLVVVHFVGFVEIHAIGGGGAGSGGGVERVERRARFLGGVGGRVGLRLEGRGHRARGRVELRHRAQSEE